MISSVVTITSVTSVNITSVRETDMTEDFVIAIPVYDRVDLVDIAAPYEILGWMAEYWQEKTSTSTSWLRTKDR